MSIPQPVGHKGSLKWIQLLINDCPHLLDTKIQSALKIKIGPINWVSPLKKDDYAEYRDGAFLNVLSLSQYVEDLHNFWPNGGPQWDALGISRDKYFLVEAKANIPELISISKAKSKRSKNLISKSLKKTQTYLNCTSLINWESGFYQYANRIAHLYFLRNLCDIDAYMIFMYFLNDNTHISTSKEAWDGSLQLQKKLLGLTNHKLQQYVVDVFIDVKNIE
jgi:hypothetical protein